MIKTILFPFKHFAWFKRLNAKITYEYLAKQIPTEDWHFMNYGYMPSDNEEQLASTHHTINQRYPLQMYHQLATKTEIRGKHVLEVGSGRGGGARHIASSFKPASYTGMDIAQHAVNLANKMHCMPNLRFIQGCAENIPLPDNSVDVVVNVESCHAYGSVPNFLNEVKRVLKPKGYLMLTDFRDVDKMNLLKTQISDSGMVCVEVKDISSNVVRAMEAEDRAKKERISNLIPGRWQNLFCEFAGVVGSKIYRNLKDGTRLYYSFVVQKPG
jgi:ubiquinone/menaquinone biosynthesis C-methylase UbiE